MRASADANPDNIDITGIGSALRRRAPKLLVWALVAGGAAFALLSLLTPKYTSEAQIAIVARSGTNPFALPGRDAAPDAVAVRMDKEAINTHVRALNSPELAAAIARDLKLNAKAEFNSALPPSSLVGRIVRAMGLSGAKRGQTEEDRVLAAYFAKLEVYAAKESRSIGIRYTSADRDLAADIANRIAESYRDALARRSLVESDDVQKALVPKIEHLQAEVEAAEGEIEKFRGQSNLFRGGPQNTSLNEQQLSELTAAESKAKTEQGEADARAKAAYEMMKRGAAEVNPDVQKSPLVQRLVQDRSRLERDISELSATLLPGHPRMKQMAAQRAGLDRQIQAEIRKVVEALEKEAKVAAARVGSIQKSLSDVKYRVVAKGGDQARLTQLEANAKAKRIELDRLQAQYEANRARVEAKVVPVEVQIIAMARPANEPASPKTLPMTLLVSFGTLLLGVGFTLMREVGGSARSPREAPAQTKAKKDAAAAAAAAAAKLQQEPSRPPVPGEVVRIASLNAVARHIQSRIASPTGARTLVVGQSPSTDPALEAIELAEHLARAGAKVVLIDWSADLGGIACELEIPASPGMAELLAGSAGFEAAIRRLPGSEAHIISAGHALARAMRAVDANQINLLLDALDEVYEHIIISGRHGLARQLFEAIEGRFDAGVLVVDIAATDGPPPAPGTFLGFEVSDLEVIRYQRGAGQPTKRGVARATKIDRRAS